MLTAFSIVREKERGTMEQLFVTPVRPLGLMLGKIMPYFVTGIIEFAVILLFMRFAFQIPIARKRLGSGSADNMLLVCKPCDWDAGFQQGEFAGGGPSTLPDGDAAEHLLVGVHVPTRHDADAGHLRSATWFLRPT